MLYWLNDRSIEFPPIEVALDDPNGLLAAGGDLRPERLVEAYRHGIFPWYEEGQPILWWSPDPRAVLFPDRVHLSRSLRKTLRNKPFQVTADQAFEAVIKACATTRERAYGTWITDQMIHSYSELHSQGIAHSIEVWLDGELVGGLYGIAMGQLFFGESMFSLTSDASKVAFVYLAGQLNAWGFQLIDCQLPNDHLMSLGAETMSRVEFRRYLDLYIDKPSLANTDNAKKWLLTWRHPESI